jgi:hypothetical protein
MAEVDPDREQEGGGEGDDGEGCGHGHDTRPAAMSDGLIASEGSGPGIG